MKLRYLYVRQVGGFFHCRSLYNIFFILNLPSIIWRPRNKVAKLCQKKFNGSMSRSYYFQRRIPQEKNCAVRFLAYPIAPDAILVLDIPSTFFSKFVVKYFP